ncbi:cupin domain-containing protein [Sphingorhabdus profundilacus]|uniref:cupin domain-containing protein n=1 Tax=Sphingorhabdus profundilacus TaxID=2509718 RepID=UPI0013666144
MTARRIQIETAHAEDFAPASDRVVRGSPRGETRNAYESADGRKYFGEWSCGEGAWRVSYSEWEYCRILEGQVRLTGDDGTVVEAGPDGNLVIEPGFEGMWENLTPVRKLYVIDLASPAVGTD